MLVHQTGRMPSKGLVVTNLDASELDDGVRDVDLLVSGLIPSMDLGNGETLQFDRILADVP